MSTARSLEEAHARVAEVVEHLGRVLRKYPPHTVEPHLRWALRTPRNVSVRVGALNVYVTSSWVGGTVEGRFPKYLLDEQISATHAWARNEYWTARRRAEQASRGAAAAKVREAEKAAADAQARLSAARRALRELSPSSR